MCCACSAPLSEAKPTGCTIRERRLSINDSSIFGTDWPQLILESIANKLIDVAGGIELGSRSISGFAASA